MKTISLQSWIIDNNIISISIHFQFSMHAQTNSCQYYTGSSTESSYRLRNCSWCNRRRCHNFQRNSLCCSAGWRISLASSTTCNPWEGGVMQANLARIVRRQDGARAPGTIRRARRKIACYLNIWRPAGAQKGCKAAGNGVDPRRRICRGSGSGPDTSGESVCQTRSYPDYLQLPSGATWSFCIPCIEQGASGRTQGQLRLHGPDRCTQMGAAEHCRIRRRS